MHQLLRILHLASPALPIGAFHFSQGLEYAIEAGWVRDEATAHDWMGGLARGVLGTLDLPILARLHDAAAKDDHTATQRWNALLIASRETEELRAEDRHLGQALIRVLRELHADIDLRKPETLGYAAVFAKACVQSGVGKVETLHAYSWAWTENQVLAAVKLVPLGQSAGQRILHKLIPSLEAAAASALELADEDIGYCSVMQSVASARHETQYTRLFRS
ncbi:urease accessory protein [Povalibacter uvarum]|uniref:Urease accessory protein UreF n=1 Tax=Povalibacter uvarum TaxID=732238 RepID=A0A841HGL9_9GAMM|nr:urease accessory protein UreF [Povalibacter uvarum]MBB6092271.1 urease accessory protein [Povalibacter uvarum]